MKSFIKYEMTNGYIIVEATDTYVAINNAGVKPTADRAKHFEQMAMLTQYINCQYALDVQPYVIAANVVALLGSMPTAKLVETW